MKIVYETNTGSTKQYAEMLGEKTGFEAMSLSKAVKELGADEEIIFMGWVMAGTVQGLQKAREVFTDIKAICPVGLSKSEKNDAELKAKNAIECPMFALQGSFHLDKLTGMYKMMMGMMMKMLKAKLKENPQPDSDKFITAIEGGVDCVSEENLVDIIEWINTQI